MGVGSEGLGWGLSGSRLWSNRVRQFLAVRRNLSICTCRRPKGRLSIVLPRLRVKLLSVRLMVVNRLNTLSRFLACLFVI